MSILTKNGIHYLSGEINQDSIEDAIVFILEANLEKKLEQLTLIINSFGGYVHQAFALVAVIFGSSIPISTLGLGAIGSCGLVIFMSGQKGKRILTPNTQILSHQWSGQAQGKQHELISTIKRNDLVQENVKALYAMHRIIRKDYFERIIASS